MNFNNSNSTLYKSDISNAGAEPAFQLTATTKSSNMNPILSQPGFYFLVNATNNVVVARYFVGNQRSKVGFNEKIPRFTTSPRSEVDKNICESLEHVEYTIMYMPYSNMKYIINPDRGQLQLMFTKSHTSVCQNFSEINRILNDLYSLTFQAH
mgnify:FL=1